MVRACLKKSRLYGQYRRSGSRENNNKFNTYKWHLEHLLNAPEKTYYSNRFRLLSGNLWKPIDDMTGKIQSENVVGPFMMVLTLMILPS